MTSATPSSSSPAPSSADVSDRVRSLQLGASERKTAEFGFRGMIWLLAVSLIAAGAWWLTQQGGSAAAGWRQWLPGAAANFEIVPVKIEGGEQVLLDGTGYITPKQKVTISARIPGQLVEVNFIEGDKVEEGQVLARLDDTMFRADFEQAQAALLAAESRLADLKKGPMDEELEQARIAVDQAQKKLVLMQNEHERKKALREDLSATEWDQHVSLLSDAEANLKLLQQKLKLLENGPRPERIKMIEAEVAQAKALVSKAEANLTNATLTSPISGIILERRGEVGENIRPEGLAPGLYTIADLTQLEVQVDVEEQSLGKLQIGQPCRVIPDAYSDRTYSARIARWQPQINRARAVVRVILTMTDPDEFLLAEMNCRVLILASGDTPEPETLWVPTKAVVPAGEAVSVFVVDEGSARQRTVELGATKDDYVQVVSGLTKTDRVILSGDSPPADGQKMQ